jgi:hypothetical protein
MTCECQPGHNTHFNNRDINIDMEHWLNNKDVSADTTDLVIEMVTTVNTEKIYFLTLCKLDEVVSGTHTILKVKPESQKLRTMGMWLEVSDVFNAALDGGECLICCTNLRNTVFLPCKHSCCCSSCSHSLRIRNNPCPICKISKNISLYL